MEVWPCAKMAQQSLQRSKRRWQQNMTSAAANPSAAGQSIEASQGTPSSAGSRCLDLPPKGAKQGHTIALDFQDLVFVV